MATAPAFRAAAIVVLAAGLVAASAGLAPAPARAAEATGTEAPKAGRGDRVEGRASVVDGDTLEIHGARIRLHGIDAPESRQSCTRAEGEWRCGTEAARALDALVADRPVSCEVRDVDRYRRLVATCRQGATDLNAAMVRAGMAMAYRRYSRDYVAAEDAARAEGKGIWAGPFTPPWDWRRGKGR